MSQTSNNISKLYSVHRSDVIVFKFAYTLLFCFQSSQRSLNHTDDDVISNGSGVPASLEKLPTNVFLDNFLERSDDDDDDEYDADDDEEVDALTGEVRTLPPSQRRGGAKLRPPEKEEDEETVLDISAREYTKTR